MNLEFDSFSCFYHSDMNLEYFLDANDASPPGSKPPPARASNRLAWIA